MILKLFRMLTSISLHWHPHKSLFHESWKWNYSQVFFLRNDLPNVHKSSKLNWVMVLLMELAGDSISLHPWLAREAQKKRKEHIRSGVTLLEQFEEQFPIVANGLMWLPILNYLKKFTNIILDPGPLNNPNFQSWFLSLAPTWIRFTRKSIPSQRHHPISPRRGTWAPHCDTWRCRSSQLSVVIAQPFVAKLIL